MVEWGLLVAMLGGLPLAGFGAWVYLQGAHDRARIAFSVFAIAMGVRPLGTYIGPFVPRLEVPGEAFADVMLYAQAAALVAFSLAYVRGRDSGPLRATAIVAGLAPVGAMVAVLALERSAALADPGFYIALAFRIAGAAFLVPLILFPLAARRAPDGPDLVLPSVALVMYPGYLAWAGGSAGTTLAARIASGNESAAAFLILLSAGLVLGAVLWLLAVEHVGRPARIAAWTYLGVPTASGIYLAVGGDAVAGYGIARFFTVALLAYALLRSELLGIDVKVRWGISKGTIAATFITVFFLAGEGAQILFGADNELIGLVAAGALVFALSPLQRFADRVAEHAVPLPEQEEERFRLYRRQASLAWSDGNLGKKERAMLRELREALAIPTETADAIEREVETAHGATPK